MKKNDKIKEEMLEQMRKVPIIELACQKANITRMTFLRWRKEDQDFSKEVENSILAGRQLINDLAESGLIGKVKDRDLSAILNWLKFHHPDYGNKIEINGKIDVAQELSPEQKDLIRKALSLSSFIQPNSNKNDNK